MAQVVLHQYPGAWVKYKFKCRNGSAFPPGYRDREQKLQYLNVINSEIMDLCTIRFRPEELEYLSKFSFFKPDFIEYLRLLQLNLDYVQMSLDESEELQIYIEGPWISTIWFEVPILAIVSELFGRHQNWPNGPSQEGQKHLNRKIENLQSFMKPQCIDGVYPHMSDPPRIVDFGTRRRFSKSNQEHVIKTFVEKVPNVFIGTSNIFFAQKYGIKPIGTMAHEFLQAHQQLGHRLRDSQKAALESWAQEYRGKLGIALTDVVGFDPFLRDFDLYFAKLFDGCRHDSGDPYWWCRKLLTHYRNLGIDPKTKQAVFSDGLSVESALELFETFHQDIQCSFGIGTNLTNDLGIKALQIVIKMVECQGKPVAKISDSNGKGMCEDPEYLEYVKKVFQIPKEE